MDRCFSRWRSGWSRSQHQQLCAWAFAAAGLSSVGRGLGGSGFRKLNFCRRGTFQPNSQRKTLTVDQYHPLRALAPLGFTHSEAPFFAGAKLPSKKVSSHLSRPSSSSAPNSARQASSQTPSSSHCFSRRQQVAGEGNWWGETATPLRFARSTGCLQSRPGSVPTVARGCPFAA